MPDDGIFLHRCLEEGCAELVQYDDEPMCFKHSPDSGSSMRGFSARAFYAEWENLIRPVLTWKTK